MATGTRLIDTIAFVHAFKEAVPSSAVPTYVSMKGYDHVGILISFKNATTVTGSAITLNQATAVSGAGAKSLAFTVAWSVVDDSTTVLPVRLAVSASTFTTDATNSKNGWYFIDVDAWTLDTANLYTSIQVGIGNATAATIGAWYLMGISPRFNGGFDSMMNPLVD
jgi:hypothetical protein